MRSEVTKPRGRKLGGDARSQLLELTTALLGGCGLETLGVLQSVRQNLFSVWVISPQNALLLMGPRLGLALQVLEP